MISTLITSGKDKTTETGKSPMAARGLGGGRSRWHSDFQGRTRLCDGRGGGTCHCICPTRSVQSREPNAHCGLWRWCRVRRFIGVIDCATPGDGNGEAGHVGAGGYVGLLSNYAVNLKILYKMSQ